MATITLNRPDKLNAWTQKMEEEVVAAIRAAAVDDQVRVIILTGAGKGFCAGADMGAAFSHLAGIGPARRAIPGGRRNGQRRPAEFRRSTPGFSPSPSRSSQPSTDRPWGSGFIVPLYCDFRFASEKARFSVIFSKRGLVAEYGLAWMLPRLIGVTNAIELMFTSKMVDAGEALRIGLVSRVLPEENFLGCGTRVRARDGHARFRRARYG